jgi:hypothetical protein
MKRSRRILFLISEKKRIKRTRHGYDRKEISAVYTEPVRQQHVRSSAKKRTPKKHLGYRKVGERPRWPLAMNE